MVQRPLKKGAPFWMTRLLVPEQVWARTRRGQTPPPTGGCPDRAGTRLPRAGTRLYPLRGRAAPNGGTPGPSGYPSAPSGYEAVPTGGSPPPVRDRLRPIRGRDSCWGRTLPPHNGQWLPGWGDTTPGGPRGFPDRAQNAVADALPAIPSGRGRYLERSQESRISFSPKSLSAWMPRLRQSSISLFDATMGFDCSVYFTLMM